MLMCRMLLTLWFCLASPLSEACAQQVLIVATSEHPPLVSAVPSQSFLTELFAAIGREMGVTFEFKFLPWKRCEPAVETLEAWGGMPFISTSYRRSRFLFSDKLYERRTIFFYYSPDGTSKQIDDKELSDLKAYKIGAVRGYYYEKALLDAGLNVEFVTSEEQNWKKLYTGRVDLIVTPEYSGFYLMKKLFPQDVKNFFALKKPLDTFDVHLVTSSGYQNAQATLNQFNSALRALRENGVYKAIFDKYVVDQ